MALKSQRRAVSAGTAAQPLRRSARLRKDLNQQQLEGGQQQQASLLSLPEEVLLSIVGLLSGRLSSYLSVAQSCKELRRLALLQAEVLTLRVDTESIKDGGFVLTPALCAALQRPSGRLTLRIVTKGSATGTQLVGRGTKATATSSEASMCRKLAQAFRALGKCRAVTKLLLLGFTRGWDAEVSQALASMVPNSSHLEIYHCCIPVPALMPLVEKHQEISLRGSFLPATPDNQGHFHHALLALLAQPNVRFLYMAGGTPITWTAYDFRPLSQPIPAEELPASSHITQLHLGYGPHNSGCLSHYVPLLKSLPALQGLALVLNSFDDACPQHYKAFLPSCSNLVTLRLPTVTVNDKELLHVLLSHQPLTHLRVSSIWLNNAAAAEGPCPTPQRLEVLQVDNIDDAALSYLPDAVLKAMAGHVFKMDIVAYHVIPDFDTEELMGGQPDMSGLVALVTGMAAQFKKADLGPWCRLVLSLDDLAEETEPGARARLSRWRAELFKRLAPLREVGLARLELEWNDISQREVTALGRVLGPSITHLCTWESTWDPSFKGCPEDALRAAFPNLQRLVITCDDEDSDFDDDDIEFVWGDAADGDEVGEGTESESEGGD